MPDPSLADAHPLDVLVRRHLAEGLRLTPETLAGIASAWGPLDPAGLTELLGTEAGGEEASLLDLLFFPDMGLQVRLEPDLAALQEEPADAARLIASLERDPPPVRLWLPGHARPAAGRMPAAAAAAFIGRLHLTWRPADALAAGLARLAGRSTAEGWPLPVVVQVRLRNAGLPAGPAQKDFLLGFLERFGADREDFAAAFDFLVGFLAAQRETTDVHQALMAHKHWLRRQQARAQREADLALGHNMETLAMAGFRPGYFDTAAAARTLALIDALALAVWGCTDADGPPEESLDVEAGGGPEAARRIMGILS